VSIFAWVLASSWPSLELLAALLWFGSHFMLGWRNFEGWGMWRRALVSAAFGLLAASLFLAAARVTRIVFDHGLA
jgi:hypothetical protein